MSNDMTTLADVQPGGRVRLGDVLPPLPEPRVIGADRHPPVKLHRGYTAEQMREYARAALSAQPSPGGQDALDCIGRIEEAIEFRVPHDIYAAVHGELAELKAALAARQPVGQGDAWDIAELVRTDLDRQSCPDAYMRIAMESVVKHLAARQPVGQIDEAAVLRRAAAVLYMWEDDPNLTGYMGDFNDACGILELLAQHAAPPAQAVDMADFKALYRAYVRLLECGRHRILDLGGTCDPVDVMEANDVDLRAARRVIGGKAVGNGPTCKADLQVASQRQESGNG